jgi:hypothetical protein
MAQNTVLRRKRKEPRPIRRSDECGEFLRIGLWRGAFEQDRPLVLNRACFEWMQKTLSVTNGW